MSIRTVFTQRVSHLTAGLKARAQLRRELQGTSDRALAELRVSRGDIEDIVTGSYARAAWAAVPSRSRALRAAGPAKARS